MACPRPVSIRTGTRADAGSVRRIFRVVPVSLAARMGSALTSP